MQRFRGARVVCRWLITHSQLKLSRTMLRCHHTQPCMLLPPSPLPPLHSNHKLKKRNRLFLTMLRCRHRQPCMLMPINMFLLLLLHSHMLKKRKAQSKEGFITELKLQVTVRMQKCQTLLHQTWHLASNRMAPLAPLLQNMHSIRTDANLVRLQAPQLLMEASRAVTMAVRTWTPGRGEEFTHFACVLGVR